MLYFNYSIYLIYLIFLFNRQSYFTYKTYRPRRPKPTYFYGSKVKFSFSRFILVFILSMCIIATIFLLFTQNCKKLWRTYKQRRYKTFKDYNYNEDGTTIDGVQLSSNVNIYENNTPSIAFRNNENDDVYFPPTRPAAKKSYLTRIMNFLRKKHDNQMEGDRAPVYLNSESDRTPDQIYRKYGKEDYKDEYFIDHANNVRVNPFVVHLI